MESIKKIGKGTLWLTKLGFVALSLYIWWLCMPLAETIIPAIQEQWEYHEFAEEFLREKYGEEIKVYNKRVPLSEMNTANFQDYKYTFRLHGKTYQFLYYVGGLNADSYFYGDNAQSDVLYELMDRAIDIIRYEIEIVDFDRIGWQYSQEVVHPEYPLTMRKEKGTAMFTLKYTGDNLKEFPISVSLYWDKETEFDKDEDRLKKIYSNMVRNLESYDISCHEINIICKGAPDYHIKESPEGIKIEKD